MGRRRKDEVPERVAKLRDKLQYNFGRRIAEIRDAKGWTQETAAERLGVSVKWLQFLEGGKSNVTLETMALMALAYKVDVRDLLATPLG